MTVSIAPIYHTALLQTPLSTPTLIGLEKSDETALALRVADLFSFRRPGLPITARPIGYQGKEGPWVVVLAFAMKREILPLREGAVYVDPLQDEGHLLLQRLGKQDRFPFLFCSPRLKVVVSQDAPWSVQHRQEIRLILAQIGHRSHYRSGESSNADFERAKQEFQRLYSLRTFLTIPPRSELHGSPHFRGVVLD
jgi:hypothetical protein